MTLQGPLPPPPPPPSMPNEPLPKGPLPPPPGATEAAKTGEQAAKSPVLKEGSSTTTDVAHLGAATLLGKTTEGTAHETAAHRPSSTGENRAGLLTDFQKGVLAKMRARKANDPPLRQEPKVPVEDQLPEGITRDRSGTGDGENLPYVLMPIPTEPQAPSAAPPPPTGAPPPPTAAPLAPTGEQAAPLAERHTVSKDATVVLSKRPNRPENANDKKIALLQQESLELAKKIAELKGKKEELTPLKDLPVSENQIEALKGQSDARSAGSISQEQAATSLQKGQEMRKESIKRDLDKLDKEISSTESKLIENRDSIAKAKEQQKTDDIQYIKDHPSIKERVTSLPNYLEGKGREFIKKVRSQSDPGPSKPSLLSGLKNRITTHLPFTQNIGQRFENLKIIAQHTLAKESVTLPDIKNMQLEGRVALFHQLRVAREEYKKLSEGEKDFFAIGYKNDGFCLVKKNDIKSQERAFNVAGELFEILNEELPNINARQYTLTKAGLTTQRSDIGTALDNLKTANKTLYEARADLRVKLQSFEIKDKKKTVIEPQRAFARAYLQKEEQILKLCRLIDPNLSFNTELGKILPNKIADVAKSLQEALDKWEKYLGNLDPKVKTYDYGFKGSQNSAMKSILGDLAKEAYNKIKSDRDPSAKELLSEMEEIAKLTGGGKAVRMADMRAKIDQLSSDEAKKAMGIAFAIKLTAGADPIPPDWPAIMEDFDELSKSPKFQPA